MTTFFSFKVVLKYTFYFSIHLVKICWNVELSLRSGQRHHFHLYYSGTIYHQTKLWTNYLWHKRKKKNPKSNSEIFWCFELGLKLNWQFHFCAQYFIESFMCFYLVLQVLIAHVLYPNHVVCCWTLLNL